MKNKIILSTVILNLLVSPIVSANNVKQNNNDIKSHQQIEKSIKQKQTEEASKQKQAEKASKQKQAEKASKENNKNNKSNLNENKIVNILNSNQLYKLSNYTILYGKYGDSIIVFNTKSEKNKFNKIVNKIESEECPSDHQFNYLVNYLNNHHGMAKFFNSQDQSIV